MPENFRGPFKVILDTEKGSVVTEVDGEYRVVVPRERIVALKDLSPLLRPHRLNCTYESGEQLTIDPEDPDVVGLRRMAQG